MTSSGARGRILLTLGSVLTLSLACNGDSNSPSGVRNLTKEAGDAQVATVASTLNPYQVKVTGADGAPKAGVTVIWSVLSGGGSVAPGSSVTDANGLASSAATLGETMGQQQVRSASGGNLVVFQSTGTAGPPVALTKVLGDGQRGLKSTQLSIAPSVEVRDQFANPVADVTVTWAPVAGSGAVGSTTSLTAVNGRASTTWTLGGNIGLMSLTASSGALDPVTFSAVASSEILVLGGGNNVPSRYTSDLWVADGYAYSGTWGLRNAQGNAVFIWQLDGNGAPVLRDSIVTPGVGTVSDIEVSPDGKWLVFTSEFGSVAGLHVYELTTPGHPVFRAQSPGVVNLHTGTLATIGGKLYAFTAKDPGSCAMRIYDLSAAATGTITLASATPIPDNYCIHDTFVRDGYAFVFAWNSGLYIFDVGHATGSPTNPVQISQTPGFGGQTHNGWWFWNPNGEKKYLFIGEEGPGSIGNSSSGDIHVVDVSDFSAPVEVASYTLAGAGTHNFWIDEPNQVLYAAYYNGGVVALDISGTLSGNLANREIARVRPGGPGNTYAWSVMLYNGSLYTSDMLSGVWQLSLP